MRYVLIFVAAFALALALTWYQRQPDRPVEIPVAETPPPETPSPGASVAKQAGDVDAEPVSSQVTFEMRRPGDAQIMMREIGFEQLDQNLAAWSLERGFPAIGEDGEFVYDQPYDQYDDTTLSTLAEGGDIWAQQVLAERLKETRPGEAAEWLRRAAGSGSIYAMVELGNLYMDNAKTNADFKLADESLALDQVFAMRDGEVAPEVAGYAWYAAAEQAGAAAVVGSMSIPSGMRRLSGQQLNDACDMASSLLTDTLAARKQAGLGEFDRTPPPVIMAPDGNPQRTDCKIDKPIFDLSNCEQITVEKDEEAQPLFWVCNNN